MGRDLKRHLLAIVGLGLLALQPLACGKGPRPVAEPLVRAYVAAWNAGDGAGLTRLLDEGAVWQIGMARADTVDCELVREDDLLASLGLAPARHFTRILVSGGRIQEIVPRREPLEMEALRARYAQFSAWLREVHPEALPRLQGAQGAGPLSAETALFTLQLAREWRASQDLPGAGAGGRPSP
ncbi:MAG: hypothetical protein E4H17_04160 [Gemmatimonadales bacterium]|nr:MAG: hypothetical protein E4H17_04160 [Gemmatimonadales bacterium]